MDTYKSAKYGEKVDHAIQSTGVEMDLTTQKKKPRYDVDTRFAMYGRPLGKKYSPDLGKPMVHHNAGETEYNKPAKTKAARSKMADKPPKISLRKAYQD
jgi:hypothetical protein